MLGLPDPGREDLAPPSIDILAVASPAAGANATIPLGEFELFAILGCRFNFTADANAANRVVCVDYIAGGVTWMRNGAAQVYAANSNTNLEGKADLTVSDFAANAPTYFPLYALPLPQGWSVQITVDNKQVGDALTAIRVVMARWTPKLS